VNASRIRAREFRDLANRLETTSNRRKLFHVPLYVTRHFGMAGFLLAFLEQWMCLDEKLFPVRVLGFRRLWGRWCTVSDPEGR